MVTTLKGLTLAAAWQILPQVKRRAAKQRIEILKLLFVLII
jgi:hypothetical protein